MGCSKNLVDSEKLMRKFADEGYDCVHDPKRPQGEIAVINTCGFIESAKEESINTILEFVERKKRGRLQKLYVMGCLSQRYREELEKEIPEVDKFYGKFDYNQLLSDLGPLRNNIAVDSSIVSQRSSRVQTTPKHYAYIKIAEGCDRHCAYCAIPLITGKHHSRPMEDVLAEVRDLVAQGVKEFQVIEQELTYYGVDIYGKTKIAELISQMADIEGVEWIRLHYTYPTSFPEDAIEAIARHRNICNYIDIPLQHINSHILSSMQRGIDREGTLRLIDRFRQLIPDVAIRTTLIAGYPGETEKEFAELMDFVREARFDRMGCFAYSPEEGTPAFRLGDPVPEEEKQRRVAELMELQESISLEINRSRIGKRLRCIVDRREGDYLVGRTEYDSPEVDDEVLIRQTTGGIRSGDFVDVRITDALENDLVGYIEH